MVSSPSKCSSPRSMTTFLISFRLRLDGTPASFPYLKYYTWFTSFSISFHSYITPAICPLALPEPVEDRAEVLRVQVQAKNISILGGIHHLGQLGVGKLGESLPGGLEHLSTNVQLYPRHLRRLWNQIALSNKFSEKIITNLRGLYFIISSNFLFTLPSYQW